MQILARRLAILALLVSITGCGRTDIFDNTGDTAEVVMGKEVTLADGHLVYVELVDDSFRSALASISNGITFEGLIDALSSDGEPDLIYDTTGPDLSGLQLFVSGRLRAVIWR